MFNKVLKAVEATSKNVKAEKLAKISFLFLAASLEQWQFIGSELCAAVRARHSEAPTKMAQVQGQLGSRANVSQLRKNPGTDYVLRQIPRRHGCAAAFENRERGRAENSH